MPSQEEYLDQLLRNIMNGGKGQPSEEEAAAGKAAAETAEDVEKIDADGSAENAQWSADMGQPAPEMSMEEEVPGELPDVLAEAPGEVPMEEVYEDPDMDDLSAFMEGMQEAPSVAAGMPEASDFGDMSALLDHMQGTPEEAPAADEMPEASDFGDMSALLNNMQGPPEETPITDGAPETSDFGDMSALLDNMQGTPEETPVADEMPETSDFGDMSALLNNMQGTPEETPAADGMPETSDFGDMSALFENMQGTSEETPAAAGAPEASDFGDLSALLDNMQGIPEETPAADGMPETSDFGDMSALLEGLQGTPGELSDEVPGVSEGISADAGLPVGLDSDDFSALMMEEPENKEETVEPPVEDDDIAELFKTFEDELDVPVEGSQSTEMPAETFPETLSADSMDVIPEEEAAGAPVMADISSMSEDDIERLLAESSKASEGGFGGSEEALQGDVVDLLQGTEDGDLQEIQGLLEKADNNEAVDGEIETILKEAAQDSNLNSTDAQRSGADADHEEEAEKQLSPRQQKIMEKKRLKEEKAAAKKAAREARKAEKAAKKSAGQKGQNAESVEETNGAAGSDESLDTAFLDSILSEAGKIDGAETTSSATGNYDAQVDNILPEEEEDAAVNPDLGIDLGSLFGDSAEAESTMMAGEDPDLADFVALDGNGTDGILELGGEDEEEEKPKKKGFFSRFLEFLTEEDEEEEENEDIKLSEENKEIIEDLDKEKAQKSKKGKKGKKKADAPSEGGEEGEEGEENKKDKKKKAKKPKKEKVPKEKEPVDPKTRLSLKKVLPIVLICLSLGAAIIITVYGAANFSDRKVARNAYYEGDYRTCYQNLYGKDLNESEQIMFGKSECILRIQMWIREYEILAAEEASLEALDSLIQSVNDYPALYDYAGQCNAAGEVAQEYATILNLLYENYGLTEDQARAIAAEPDDIEYTRQINMIVQGGTYGSWNEPEPEEDVPLQDELPEETELPEGNFIDTNASAQQ